VIRLAPACSPAGRFVPLSSVLFSSDKAVVWVEQLTTRLTTRMVGRMEAVDKAVDIAVDKAVVWVERLTGLSFGQSG
jgi:hypothetical protein